jgi:hypothetical protein
MSKQDSDKGMSSGDVLLGVATFVLSGLVIAALVAFPGLTGGDGVQEQPSGTKTAVHDTTLENHFSDQPTQIYLKKLAATFPSSASDLRTRLNDARSRGADDTELGVLVLQSGAGDIYGSLDRLSKTDVRFFERLLDFASDKLNALSASGEPYCNGTDLVQYAGLAEQDLYRTVLESARHGTPLYEAGLELNGIFLDAIRDARSNPHYHDRLSPSDMGALQTLGLAMLTDPDMVRLLTTEGKSRTEMDAALEAVDFCELGLRMVNRIEGLPQATKGRVWNEALTLLRTQGLQRMIWRLQGY